MNTESTSKLRTYLLACTLGAVAMVSASHGFAQGKEMRVNVPFAFHSGSQRMPAGVYMVTIESQHLILLRGDSTTGFVNANPEIGKPAAKGKLVFKRYGNQYFLREVWTAQSETGQKCVKSKLEREIEIAQNKAAQPGAELALNQQPR
ncbi:MAG: hypothetical protein QOJ51_2270 [Acidobacteriaceae bacterium]|nr:hypothetical protein [Acidobacteriaceae bacterium]